MSAPQRFRLAILPLLPVALAALVWLGISAFRAALAQGGDAVWLMAWVLAFLVGMPLLVLGLAVAGELQLHGPRVRSALPLPDAGIPNAGVKIPKAGQ